MFYLTVLDRGEEFRKASMLRISNKDEILKTLKESGAKPAKVFGES